MTKLKILRSTPARLAGLLFSKPGEDVVMLLPCCDIHTFGMRRSIDVAFVDHRGVVVQSMRNVAPRCRIRCPQACAVLERSSHGGKKWFSVGRYAGSAVHHAIKQNS